MSGSIWRVIAIGLFTLISGAMGTWATIGMDKVTRAEVREMIRIEAPSASQMEAMRNEIVALKIEQARSADKLDLILKKFGLR